MEIRKDLVSASIILNRLLLYAETYRAYWREAWRNLKIEDDYEQVYKMEDDVKVKFERIYSEGRGFAFDMSPRLLAFNEPAKFPTLTSYVKSFDDEWLAYYIGTLKGFLKDALETKDKINYCPNAVNGMIELFDEQLKLYQTVIVTINLLKDTEIYKIENGVSDILTETEFIDSSIIESLCQEKNKKHDLAKVIKFCQEINTTFNSGDYLATSMLIRALINHVPPIFGHETFKQVASQSTKSRQALFKPLDETARDVADLHTHDTIRHKENLPTKRQLEPFKSNIEFLLQEILTELQKQESFNS